LHLLMAHRIRQQNPATVTPTTKLLLAKAIVLVVLAGACTFSGHWLTLLWLLQGAAMCWAAAHLGSTWMRLGGHGLLLLGLGKLLLHDYDQLHAVRWENWSFAQGYTHLLAQRWLNLVAAVMTVGLSARWLRSGFLWALTGVLLFGLLLLEQAAFMHDYLPVASFAATSIYLGAFAAGLVALGFGLRLAMLRRLGIALFGLTLLKVLISDMARASTPWRILSFVLLGVLLIGASFLYHRFRHRFARPPAADDPSTASPSPPDQPLPPPL